MTIEEMTIKGKKGCVLFFIRQVI